MAAPGMLWTFDRHCYLKVPEAAVTECTEGLVRRGLDPALRRRYQRRAALAAVAAAEQLQARGGAVILCEHAYLLAIESWNALDDFVAVGTCFAALAALPLPAERQQRYLRLVENYSRPPQPAPLATSAASAEAGEALPAFLRQQQAYPPIWLLDLLEWEAAGDPAAVCLALLGDTQRALLTRRHALVVLLLSHAAAAPSAARSARCRARLRPRCGRSLRRRSRPHPGSRDAPT